MCTHCEMTQLRQDARHRGCRSTSDNPADYRPSRRLRWKFRRARAAWSAWCARTGACELHAFNCPD